MEIPSTLFENFCYVDEIFNQFLQNAGLKVKIAQTLRNDKKEWEKLLAISRADIQFHSLRLSSLEDFYTAIRKEAKKILPISNHVIHYGSGYYSYALSKVVSHKLWNRLFKQNRFSHVEGSLLDKQLLSYGGSKDPVVLLKSLGVDTFQL